MPSRAPAPSLAISKLRIVLTPIFLLLFVDGLAAQTDALPATADDRKHALELYDQNKFTEALPLLEKLAVELPKDMPQTVKAIWAK